MLPAKGGPRACGFVNEPVSDEKEAAAVRNLTWRVRAPIGERIKKVSEVGITRSLKKKVDSTRFVYFHGITKQRQAEVRRSLSALKINTKEVINISFVGKQVCAILTKSTYAPALIKKLVSRGGRYSTLRITIPSPPRT